MSDSEKTILDSQVTPPAVGEEGSGKSPFPGYVTGMLRKEQAEALRTEFANDPKVAEGLPKGIPELFESWRTSQAKLRTAVQIPGKDATDAEKAAYRKAMGVPDSPDGYTLDHSLIPQELYDPSFESWFKTAAHRNGLSSDAAQTLYKEYNETILKTVQAQNQKKAQDAQAKQQESQKAYGEAVAKLQGEWGDRYSERVSGANQAFMNDKLIPPALRQKLQANGLGNDVEFIRLMDVLHSVTRSDRRIGLRTEAGEGTPTGFDYGKAFSERYPGRR